MRINIQLNRADKLCSIWVYVRYAKFINLIKGARMKIEIKSKDCVYITINNIVYYIDDSTGERIIRKWKENKDA